MALANKQRSKSLPRLPQLAGVNNYDKLKNVKGFDTYNPFISNTFNKKAKKNHEASSMDERYLDDEIYNQMLMFNGYNKHSRTGNRTSYYGLDLKVRRQQMVRLSAHDIIDEVLTKLCNEVVVTTDNKPAISLQVKNDLLDAQKINEGYKKEVVEYSQKAFTRIVKMYGLDQTDSETSLWNKCWHFLTEGSQAYELIWNDPKNPKFISGIHEIDALETEPFFYQGAKYWKHHKTASVREEHIILYDRQIVYVDYSKAQPNSRMSYLEHLMKSFNDLRIIDETTINWAITNSTFRQMLTVPTKGLSRTQAAAAVAREMSRWNDEITYDGSTGVVTVNGQNRLQMMKSIYVADGASGKPEFENMAGDGPDFSSMEKNQFFEKRFYKAAKMPMSRFDNSSESWNIDTRSTLREEIYFGRFVDKLRQLLKMLVLKPLRLELVARFPELSKDEAIDAFDIKFNTYNVFEQLMELDIIKEKIEFISEINDKFILNTADGSEMKYFSLEFLIENYLPEITEEKRKRNEVLRVLQDKKLFEYQIKIHQLQAKYDPSLRMDDMGKPDVEGVIKDSTEAVGAPNDWSKMYDDEEDEDDDKSGTSTDALKDEIRDSKKLADKLQAQKDKKKKEKGSGDDVDTVSKDKEKDLLKQPYNQQFKK